MVDLVYITLLICLIITLIILVVGLSLEGWSVLGGILLAGNIGIIIMLSVMLINSNTLDNYCEQHGHRYYDISTSVRPGYIACCSRQYGNNIYVKDECIAVRRPE